MYKGPKAFVAARQTSRKVSVTIANETLKVHVSSPSVLEEICDGNFENRVDKT